MFQIADNRHYVEIMTIVPHKTIDNCTTFKSDYALLQR